MTEVSDHSASIRFANLGVPVLCQATGLRSLGGGQVDYCFIDKEKLFVIEAKMGNNVTRNQVSRLKTSGRILSDLLGASCAKVLLYSVKNGDVYGL